MISKFNSKLEYQIKIGKLSITRFAGFLLSFFSNYSGTQPGLGLAWAWLGCDNFK